MQVNEKECGVCKKREKGRIKRGWKRREECELIWVFSVTIPLWKTWSYIIVHQFVD
jgi:hypothetical protein